MRRISTRFLHFLKKLQPDSAFLSLGIVFGIIFCGASVPFMVPDEIAHFYRSYQVSELKFFSEVHSYYNIGGEIPTSLQVMTSNFDWMVDLPASRIPAGKILSLFEIPLQPKEKAFISFKNTAVYTPIAYLPQAAGILTGRFLGAPVMSIFYMGRLVNLVVFLALTWGAIRSIPILKWALLALALMPMTISQSASLSPDALLNGAAFLFIARLLKAALNGKEPICNREVAFWIVMLSVMTMIKPIYLTLGLLILWVGWKRFGGWLRYGLALVLAAGIPLVLYMSWQIILTNGGISGGLDSRINASLQFQYVRSDIGGFILLLAKTYAEMLVPIMVMAVGYFGWLNQPQPTWVYPIYFIFAFFLTMFDNHYPRFRIKAWPRIVSVLTILVCIIAIASVNYIFGNPVGDTKIQGIHGRYYIPLGILLSVILYNHFFRIQSWIVGVLASAGSVFFMIIAILTLASRIQF